MLNLDGFLGPGGELRQDSPRAVLAHAAQLLALGVRLTGDESLLADDAPALRTAATALTGPFRQADAQQFLAATAPTAGGFQAHTGVEPFGRLWRIVGTADGGEATAAAATLLHLAARSRHEPVRVIGAAELTRIAGGGDAETVQTLLDGLHSTDPTIGAVARQAVTRLGADPQPDDDSARQAAGPTPVALPEAPAIMVHGTGAQLRSAWWRPGGDLFDHVRATVSPNLYAHPDHFRWDGRYRADARRQAADDLNRWARHRGVPEFDIVYAHSHGGNVVLDALAGNDVRVRLLVLLSTPARTRPATEWRRILDRAGRIIHLHARFDLVVLADRSRQRFAPPVHDVTLPDVWCSHVAVLDPGVWHRHRLDQAIRYATDMAAPSS